MGVFLKRGTMYHMTENNFSVLDALDEGIYKTEQNPNTGEIFLVKIADKFDFDFKLYGIDDALVSHIVNMYNKQPYKRNIGVLLNGAKGTGKTVTAKFIANKLGLPVILCDKPLGGLAGFLASIDHDCVFMFDEFEKNFRIDNDCNEDRAGEDLLSIMDGVYNNGSCHVFILTTNELRVNDNLICRPSRIRYLKSFGDCMDKKILEEYVYDNLNDKSKAKDILDFIDSLTIATIDIAKSIVDEINILGCNIEDFKQFFNVKEAEYNYYIRSWVAEKEDASVNKDIFLKHVHAPYTKELEWRPTYNYLNTNKPINKFSVGDFIENERWEIKEIDLARGFILLDDTCYRNRHRFVYIENMDEKPSIYKNRSAAYAYDDYDF